ncbi:BLUF domain-containing protein [Hymenobacter metallilatus]|uniref:BLUF domain-containing protein n=1 Tax=Hymenobacter metallilatus TaxID=2493666 RepID=A0A428JM47_9BACT|nr:BLUF domain-containing protein [Hymenobacter metallilatus]RSK34022.1 BLUF domain-containing protein [Hymenobacter metallilatus]
MASLHHLIYQSTAAIDLSGMDLGRMLSQSRTRNTAADITGMLLYDGVRFLQVLEGPVEAVSTTFARICSDCRHTQVQMLANGPVAQRQFGQWAMGLANYVSSPEVGFVDPHPILLTLTDASLCMLLHDFQQYTGAGRVQHPF